VGGGWDGLVPGDVTATGSLAVRSRWSSTCTWTATQRPPTRWRPTPSAWAP